MKSKKNIRPRPKKTHIQRSTKCSLKFSNSGKLNFIEQFIQEYTKACQQFINILWENKDKEIQSLLSKDITSQVETNISARAIQCCAKQASSIVRGTIRKHNKRMFKLKELMKNGKITKKLQKIIAKTKLTKPELEVINPELDQRFIKVVTSNNSFDMWLKLSCTGIHETIHLPLKKHKHFNYLIEQGFSLSPGCRLSAQDISFNFSKPKELVKRTEGSKKATDIGSLNVWTLNDGSSSQPCPHKHTLASIQKKMSRKKKGSKAFRRCQTHNIQHINWSLKQMNLDGVLELRRENLWDMKRFKNTGRYLTHWNYREILSKLDRLCEEQGVLVTKVSPTYTSQRCSQCGWTRKSNRKGKIFKCGACGFTCDADLNGSRNIVLELPVITKEQRLSRINVKGFYWYEIGQEFIVPCVQGEIYLRSVE